jgi:hypothetical protein
MPLQNDIVQDDASILLALRDAVKIERDGLIRHQMKTTADAIQDLTKALAANPTPYFMRALNCMWVRGIHYLTIARGGPTNTGPLAPSASDTAQFLAAA